MPLTTVIATIFLGRSAPAASLWSVLALQDYNTRLVVLSVALLGAAAGALGTFVLLRKRALLGDAISHATLPGICGAFLIGGALGFDGKSLPLLLAGALVTGGLGAAAILGISRWTRLKEDAALGIVLSVFFGAGTALSVLVQKLQTGHAAGLESFIYGKTAAMIAFDGWLILGGAAATVVLTLALFKELRLLCFDAGYAGAQGWPVLLLDGLLTGLLLAVTVIGLQAVGLILMIALLIIPAAAARFWTDQLAATAWIAATIGGLSGAVGALVSALAPSLPSGAMIVLVATGFFGVSLLIGATRGALVLGWRRMTLNRKMRRQHLLRALYELSESGDADEVALHDLLRLRAWSRSELQRSLAAAASDGLVARAAGSDSWRLTATGRDAGWRVTRNHRLWELFLISYAEIAPSHVDRDADAVEHVLDPPMIAELETQLAANYPDLAQPHSPHAVTAGGTR